MGLFANQTTTTPPAKAAGFLHELTQNQLRYVILSLLFPQELDVTRVSLSGYSEKSARQRLHDLEHDERVQALLALQPDQESEQRAESEELTRGDAIAILESTARDPRARPGDKLAALKELSTLRDWQSQNATNEKSYLQELMQQVAASATPLPTEEEFEAARKLGMQIDEPEA